MTNPDDITQNVYFFLTLSATAVGVVHLILRYINRSNCKTCRLCGCLVVERIVETENDNVEIRRRTTPDSII